MIVRSYFEEEVLRPTESDYQIAMTDGWLTFGEVQLDLARRAIG
jgi:hypothetical protein